MPVPSEFHDRIAAQLKEIQSQGLYKNERSITSQQDARIQVDDSDPVLNFCANNYLGLANHPDLIDAACGATQTNGFGMASVRFICGTQSAHQSLESELAAFLGTEDTILYTSCFDAKRRTF